jgi:hypothetical protein
MLKFEVTLNEIDYSYMIINTLPKLLNDLAYKDEKLNKLMALLYNQNVVPSVMLANALNTLSQEQINNTVVGIATLYSEDIVKTVNEIIKKEQLNVEIARIKVDNI